MTLDLKNRCFSDFLEIFGCKKVNCDGDSLEQDYLQTGTATGYRTSYEH